MNNACKVEECKITEMEQPTFKDILMELNRLKLENGCLKADNGALVKERDEWKEGFELLHNMIEEQEQNDDEGGYTEEEIETLAKGYADFGY